jgi:AraC-like DNA-binding protein
MMTEVQEFRTKADQGHDLIYPPNADPHDFEPKPEDLVTVEGASLIVEHGLHLDAWASDHGLAAETLSRGFSKLFGLTPANFRAEARTLRAFDRIISSTTSLCEISALARFADQSHMSRAIKTLTGVSPGHWRASISFKTAAAVKA